MVVFIEDLHTTHTYWPPACTPEGPKENEWPEGRDGAAILISGSCRVFGMPGVSLNVVLIVSWLCCSPSWLAIVRRKRAEMSSVATAAATTAAKWFGCQFLNYHEKLAPFLGWPAGWLGRSDEPGAVSLQSAEYAADTQECLLSQLASGRQTNQVATTTTIITFVVIIIALPASDLSAVRLSGAPNWIQFGPLLRAIPS